MQLGLSTGLFYKQDLINYLPLIKESGFEIIELCLDTIEWGPPNKWNVNSSHFFLKEGLEIWWQKIHCYNLRNKFREFGISVHSLHLPVYPELDLASLDENVRIHAVWEFKKGIDVLNYLGGQIAIVHPSVRPFDLNNNDEKKRRLENCRQSLTELLEYSKTKNIKLAVENLLPHLLGGRAEDLAQLVDILASENVGICFDTSHANIAQDPLSLLKNFNKRIISLHLSDNHGQYDDHLTPGDGGIYWPALLGGLKEIGYKNIFMLEVFTKEENADMGQLLANIYEQASRVLDNDASQEREALKLAMNCRGK